MEIQAPHSCRNMILNYVKLEARRMATAAGTVAASILLYFPKDLIPPEGSFSFVDSLVENQAVRGVKLGSEFIGNYLKAIVTLTLALGVGKLVAGSRGPGYNQLHRVAVITALACAAFEPLRSAFETIVLRILVEGEEFSGPLAFYAEQLRTTGYKWVAFIATVGALFYYFNPPLAPQAEPARRREKANA